jgi:hypothetical protein
MLRIKGVSSRRGDNPTRLKREKLFIISNIVGCCELVGKSRVTL